MFDTPIAEGGIVAAAIGMGAYGLRPVAEIQFADYIYPGFDQIVSRGRRASATARPANVTAPMIDPLALWRRHLRRPDPQPDRPRPCSPTSPGIKTVIPSNPYDAKGLLIAAIEDDDPVIFFEPKRIYNGPFDGYLRPPGDALGEASREPRCPRAITRCRSARRRSCARATTLTILAYGTMVHVALAAAEADGHRRRGHRPAHARAGRHRDDRGSRSKKTGRCVVVHEATRTAGFGAELAALVQERCFYHLEAPIERVTGCDTPYPHSLRMGLFPGPGAARRGAASRIGGLSAMARFDFKLPDIGEGIAEAEIVAWHVKVGDRVDEDQQLADMMTDKATVEMESPVAGKVLEVAGEVGDMIPIGSVLVVIETDGEGAAAVDAPPKQPSTVVPAPTSRRRRRRDRPPSAGPRTCRSSPTVAKANGARPRSRRPRDGARRRSTPTPAPTVGLNAAARSRRYRPRRPVLASPAVRAPRARPRHRPCHR